MATNKKRKKKAEVMAEDGSMTLTGHLKELRNRLIICAVVFVVGVVVSLAYADRLIDLLTAMGRDYYQFVSIAPQEKLMQYFRVSILAGVVVTVPVAFYNIYAFAKPGLKKSESTFFKLVMLLGLILFCVGVLFAYKLMMPFMLRFLSTGIEGAEYIQTTTSIESYVNLCLTMWLSHLPESPGLFQDTFLPEARTGIQPAGRSTLLSSCLSVHDTHIPSLLLRHHPNMSSRYP